MSSIDNVLLLRLQVEYADCPIAATIAHNGVVGVEADISDSRTL